MWSGKSRRTRARLGMDFLRLKTSKSVKRYKIYSLMSQNIYNNIFIYIDKPHSAAGISYLYYVCVCVWIIYKYQRYYAFMCTSVYSAYII